MFRTAMIAALGVVLMGPPALAVELPDTLAAEIMTLIPEADLDGRDFSQEEIDALQAAMHEGESAADKTTRVQQILDEGLDGAAAN